MNPRHGTAGSKPGRISKKINAAHIHCREVRGGILREIGVFRLFRELLLNHVGDLAVHRLEDGAVAVLRSGVVTAESRLVRPTISPVAGLNIVT